MRQAPKKLINWISCAAPNPTNTPPHHALSGVLSNDGGALIFARQEKEETKGGIIQHESQTHDLWTSCNLANQIAKDTSAGLFFLCIYNQLKRILNSASILLWTSSPQHILDFVLFGSRASIRRTTPCQFIGTLRKYHQHCCRMIGLHRIFELWLIFAIANR